MGRGSIAVGVDGVIEFRDARLQLLSWVAFAVVLWFVVPRHRILVAAAIGGALVAALGIAGPAVEQLPGAPFAGSSALFVGLALFVVPFVVVGDRLTGQFLARRFRRMPSSVSYLVAGASGLVAFVGSLAALIWVNEVHPDLRGNYEIALVGGLLTACVAVIRHDRSVRSGKTLGQGKGSP
jgi:hypothetical protein